MLNSSNEIKKWEFLYKVVHQHSGRLLSSQYEDLGKWEPNCDNDFQHTLHTENVRIVGATNLQNFPQFLLYTILTTADPTMSGIMRIGCWTSIQVQIVQLTQRMSSWIPLKVSVNCAGLTDRSVLTCYCSKQPSHILQLHRYTVQ